MGDKGASSKRSRSWEVDVSLDELVEWDALEQFMQDMPCAEPSIPQELSRSCGPVCEHPSMQMSSRSVFAGNTAARGSADGNTRMLGSGGNMAPGAWPMMSSSFESGFMGGALGSANGVTPNAASLAESLYAGWQQGGTGYPLQALSMQRGVSWGTELLPFVMDGIGDDSVIMDPSMMSESPNMSLGSDVATQAAFVGLGAADAEDDGPSSTGRPMHKQRFVWTSELHRRFEAAVNTLGIDQAKPQVRRTRRLCPLDSPRRCQHSHVPRRPSWHPTMAPRSLPICAQAISQLMNCEGEGAPTRQNIKSHLQKYRLLMQKRARQGSGAEGGSSGAGEAQSDLKGGGSGAEEPTDVQSELEQHLAKQEMNLKMQMDLQTKLHRQLLVQRQLQHQLEHCFPGEQDGGECADRQRYHATLQLKNSLRERLTKHVMLQQEMLQHLDALVSNEASKTSDGAGSEGDNNSGDATAAEPSTAVTDPEPPRADAPPDLPSLCACADASAASVAVDGNGGS